MKNTARKLLAFMLAAVLVLALNTVAFAAEQPVDANKDSYTIKIKTTMDNAGSFSAYQIFKGKLATEVRDDETVKILSDIQWGDGIPETDRVNVINAVKGIAGIEAKLAEAGLDLSKADDINKAAAVIASALDGATEEVAKDFADAIAKFLTQNPHASAEGTTAGEELAINVTEAGYYMVKSNKPEGGNTEDYAETLYMLQVVGDVDVTEKADIPSVEKKVKDINDIEGKETDWQDSADYDIGDDVPFQLSATLPSNYNDYDSYTLTFHDDQSAGLTFKSSPITVKYVPETGDEITLTADDYTITTEGLTDGCDFEITIKNLKSKLESITDKNHPGKVVVEYEATLNEKAVIGATGNPNDVYLEYSNNPNGDGTGKTPKDTVIVFTFELDVEKVDEDQEPLEGAGFTLYKYVDGGYVALKFTEVVDEEAGTRKYILDPDGTVTELAYEDMTKFPFVGLDDGQYKLSETTTPPTYNTIEDIEFTITSTHEDTPAPALTELKFETTATSKGEATFTNDSTLGIGSTKIMNQKGAQLPSTGGIGTTIFYVVGAILAVGAGILLIAKKRMQNHE